ncbi:MAG: AEC family transporter [Clostridia bacterium]|nr:AEC family transporter [Clostridia bacterium]
MQLFLATLNQMAFLFTFIIIGYILSKLKVVQDNSEAVLSRLENYVFIPALVLGTFINNFTTEKLSTSWKLILGCFTLEAVVIVVSIAAVKLISKNKYIQNIYLYGLCFSNFSFMGNAVVSTLFPDIFLEYIVFTLVLWTLIYIWGAPSLLIGGSENKGIKDRLKSFLNPMFICMIIGMLIGILKIPMPDFVDTAITATSGCMSPVAMLLTGMTIAKIDIKKVLKVKSIYVVSFLRLIVYPLLFIGFLMLVPMNKTFAICAVASLAMPLGLNTIVIPAAYGKDTTTASGMALISHVLAIITIPVIFLIFDKVM